MGSLLSSLWSLGTVLGTASLTIGDTEGILGTTNNVITNTGEVLDLPATQQDDGVLLPMPGM
jgi:hypothetical protein